MKASTARARKATKKTARADKPRERARRAEALILVLESKLDRQAAVVAFWLGAIEASLGKDRAIELAHRAQEIAEQRFPVSAEERAIDELPF